LTERWTLEWLEENDELKQGKTTLKKILLDLEELVLGNAGVDPFEEILTQNSSQSEKTKLNSISSLSVTKSFKYILG